MERLLQSDHFTIQSKIRWFPSLTTKFQIVNDEDGKIGEIIFHPVLMAPVLWFFGLLLEITMVGGGFYFIFKGEGNLKFVGMAMAVLGIILMFAVKFRTFLSSRASSSVEVFDANGVALLDARKGWALWRPTFTIKKNQDDKLLGESRQSFLWGDRHYTLWDADGNEWGSIRRRIWGMQYRVYKGKEQVGRFRRKLIDARKLITGMRSYLLEFQNNELSIDERAFILGSIAYVDVLVRQKELREDKENKESVPTSTKK